MLHSAGSSGYLQLFSFKGSSSGGQPEAPLIYFNGTFYGTTSSYGSGYGTVFSMTPFGRVRVLHAFTDSFSDGAYPEAGLTVMNGTLYGTTASGGKYGGGIVFSVSTSGDEHVVYNFGRYHDGVFPQSQLLPIAGVLYGTTRNGGTRDKGTVFAVTSSGQERVIHSFAGAPTDGGHPGAGLIRVRNWLYGTTLAGGQIKAGGSVYRINVLGQERVLHGFGVTTGDGEGPSGTLLYYGGVLFGTTLIGGQYGSGTVFEMSTGGSELVLHSFGRSTDGATPAGALAEAGGNLYGTTTGGGYFPSKPNYCTALQGAKALTSGRCGVIYRVDQLGRERVIYRFTGYPDGANPDAPLINVADLLYGTTYWGGGSKYYGSIFKLLP
ncbi:MAG: hypothetical protein JO113_06905 [Candidatus Eremiobacteraeota bacterium]|nr:hypothetical protein [Candidatus Eremiobacteraeota bacterium]